MALFKIEDYPVAEPVRRRYLCPHPVKTFRRYTYNNGGDRYCYQCHECAGKIQPHLGRRRAMAEWGVSSYDCDFADEVDHGLSSGAWEAKLALMERAESAAWWDWYNGYLNSPQWTARRMAVLERDGNKCRGCRAPASQVHHLSYQFVGREPLEDLVAVCDRCHENVHRRAA